MSKILKWFGSLSTKESRRDVWVVFLTTVGVSCLFDFVSCENNTILMTVIGGMFTDLLGGTAAEAYKYSTELKTKNTDI